MDGYTKIGRIRPNYTGAWNAETAYTVLEMVKNEAGTASYIAKQDVPAGTPLTDKAYWAMVLDAGEVIEAAEQAAERANNAADALGIVPTATGSVIAINDASDMPLKGLKLYGKTTQNGTPTPETPVDLVSVGDSGSVGVMVCGKNLFIANIDEPILYTYIGTTGTAYTRRGYMLKVPVGIYSIRAHAQNQSNGGYLCVTVLDGDGRAVGAVRYVVNNGATNTYNIDVQSGQKIFVFDVSSSANSENEATIQKFKVYRFQIEAGTRATEYEAPVNPPITVQTPNGLAGIPVSTGGNYTDADGQQWVCDEIDFERNIYVKRIGVVENYSGETITTTYISSTGALTAGAYIQYILDEPIETPLTAEEIAAFRALHTNKPNTTIYNDAGAEMEVKYVADTKLYIDNKFAALQEAIINA